ncbi:unnamed protein product [Caenorhabditis auriculariae]|uniref:Uncharacterized protein n=1 Tax=Caenorhabditis auriculariae TaxID=2777116 RepID=A0A8S1H9X5_9PELO|nr:unnamed protein product [Caenorhabditis auriculariae]
MKLGTEVMKPLECVSVDLSSVLSLHRLLRGSSLVDCRSRADFRVEQKPLANINCKPVVKSAADQSEIVGKKEVASRLSPVSPPKASIKKSLKGTEASHSGPSSCRVLQFDAPEFNNVKLFDMQTPAIDVSFGQPIAPSEGQHLNNLFANTLNNSDTTRSQSRSTDGTDTTDASHGNNSDEIGAGGSTSAGGDVSSPHQPITNLNMALQHASLNSDFANFNNADLFSFQNNSLLPYPMLSQFGRNGHMNKSNPSLLFTCPEHVYFYQERAGRPLAKAFLGAHSPFL